LEEDRAVTTSHGWISGLDLGGFDAESDRRLGEYFVKTRYVEEAIRGRRTIFLGRKGSGKSALFTQLPDLYHKAGGHAPARRGRSAAVL
jgi:hypothetical protein